MQKRVFRRRDRLSYQKKGERRDPTRGCINEQIPDRGTQIVIISHLEDIILPSDAKTSKGCKEKGMRIAEKGGESEKGTTLSQ